MNPAGGAGLLYEEEITAAGTKRKHYLSAGEVSVGAVVCMSGSACTATQAQYWHGDAQGSVTAVTGAGGAVTELMDYEPFGKRRYPGGPTDQANTLTAATDRGYTGHEHLDEVGLINMNGRVYDPSLSRFMSADPHVTFPGDMQSYNRYSYVLNQPFAWTDPSGYDAWGGETKGDANSTAHYYTATIAQNSSSSSGSSSSKPPSSGSAQLQESYKDVGNKGEQSRDSGFGIKLAVQNWIDGKVEKANYSLTSRVVGAAATAANEFLTPDSGLDVALAALGPFKVVGKLGKVADLAGDAAKGGLFRGGSSVTARLGVDVKAASDGMIHPLSKNGKPQGLSLNLDPKDSFIQKYGGAFPVNSLPEGLQALQSGKAGHFVVAPSTPMTFEKYQGLLNQIQLGNFNVLP